MGSTPLSITEPKVSDAKALMSLTSIFKSV